ncbi:hypothetical protein [Streptomyces sp. NRRL F-2664]|uniref:hypothetical protein n=1 Tax=Streptomyces sp. NRRL F-2664 TaxID=1463842 RepID=UPI0004C829B6|nr:hypothetical protein [Streptomyces sp. NRRL F-2664]
MKKIAFGSVLVAVAASTCLISSAWAEGTEQPKSVPLVDVSLSHGRPFDSSLTIQPDGSWKVYHLDARDAPFVWDKGQLSTLQRSALAAYVKAFQEKEAALPSRPAEGCISEYQLTVGKGSGATTLKGCLDKDKLNSSLPNFNAAASLLLKATTYDDATV